MHVCINVYMYFFLSWSQIRTYLFGNNHGNHMYTYIFCSVTYYVRVFVEFSVPGSSTAVPEKFLEIMNKHFSDSLKYLYTVSIYLVFKLFLVILRLSAKG